MRGPHGTNGLFPPRSGRPGTPFRRGQTPAPRSSRWSLLAGWLVAGALATHGGETLAAQPPMGGPGGLGGGAPPPGQGQQDKKEGPAEEAPKDKDALQPIEPIPAHPRRLRRVQLFDLHGYMRLRADYFHRLDMDLDAQEPDPALKFFPPPAQTPEPNENDNLIPNQADCLSRLTDRGVSVMRAGTRCRRRKGQASANMRLRLEPSLHITDTVAVHTQIDIFDNLVLGSTPDAFGTDNPSAPLNLFTRSQVPSQRGQNDVIDSIVAKRAWGHIRFGWGLDLRFGRMPWSWGMGMVANDGNGYDRGDDADIIRHVDQDYGDSVDSVRAAFEFGKDRRSTHEIAISWDWASSGPTTAQLLGDEWASGGTVGQAFSVEKFDNLYQWSISLRRRDDPDMLRRKVSLGVPVINYGFIGWIRYQDVDAAQGISYSTLDDYSRLLVNRRAIVGTPDLWFRLNWRTLRLEFEAAGNFGVFNLRDDIDAEPPLTLDEAALLEPSDLHREVIANFGYALEFKYGFFDDRFHIGFDHGFAMGDTKPPLGQNPLSPLNQTTQGQSNRLSNFRFNPAFNTDLLLFRESLGTISNAAYFKPWAAFYFFEHFSVRADVEYALAARPQSTLNTERYSYGVEIDGAARYHDAREPIFFQLQYGVLFPLGAFDRRLPDGGVEDARAIQTVQAQLGIRF